MFNSLLDHDIRAGARVITDDTLTNYNRSDAELQEFLLFAICVAGKTAEQQAKKLDRMLGAMEYDRMYRFPNPHRLARKGWGYVLEPFDLVSYAIQRRTLPQYLRSVGMGKYVLLERAFAAVTDGYPFARTLDLRTATVQELEAIHGIGPKTARFFILHSRSHAQVAALDTHILKAMAQWGYDVPKATPVGKRYLELESAFLKEAKRRGYDPAALDLGLWMHFAGRQTAPPKMLARSRLARSV